MAKINRLGAIEVRCRCGQNVILEHDQDSPFPFDGWGRRQCSQCFLWITCDNQGQNVEISEFSGRGSNLFVAVHPNRKHNVKLYYLQDSKRDFSIAKERFEHPHHCGHDFWGKNVPFGDVVQCGVCKGFFIHARQQVWCSHVHNAYPSAVHETFSGGIDEWKGGVWYPVNVQERF